MTTATKITLVRIFLIPIFLVLMYWSVRSEAMCYAAFAVFVIASLTDLVDGKIARAYHQVIDPLADKVLVIAAMAMFCEWGSFPAWALMIVLTREFAVGGLRMIAAGSGRVIAAAKSGKIKTAVTMAGICTMLFFRGEFFLTLAETYICASFSVILEWVVVALITVTTLYSGIEYFVKNKDVFKS